MFIKLLERSERIKKKKKLMKQQKPVIKPYVKRFLNGVSFVKSGQTLPTDPKPSDCAEEIANKNEVHFTPEIRVLISNQLKSRYNFCFVL